MKSEIHELHYDIADSAFMVTFLLSFFIFIFTKYSILCSSSFYSCSGC